MFCLFFCNYQYSRGKAVLFYFLLDVRTALLNEVYAVKCYAQFTPADSKQRLTPDFIEQFRRDLSAHVNI